MSTTRFRRGTGPGVGIQVYDGAAGSVDGIGSAATLVVNGEGRQITLPMTPEPNGWRTALPPLSEGVYRLDVQVRDAWQGTSVYGVAPLAVLDPMDGEP